MTTTTLSSLSKEVTIGFGHPFVMIGERINPTGRKILAAEMKVGDYSRVVADAIAQVAAGAVWSKIRGRGRLCCPANLEMSLSLLHTLINPAHGSIERF